MIDTVEPRVRGLVAEQLGVGPEELRAEVLLADDLAADSLDLVELVLVLESRLGILIPESALENVRTYGELVETVQSLLRGRHEADLDDEVRAAPTAVWARVVPARGGGGDLQRVGWLTPYTTETIVEDALHAGPGARLEVSVSSKVSDAQVRLLHAEFAWLRERGIEVSVRRDHHLGGVAHPALPHVAA